ncbi:hypothetical protein CYMTET_32044 [Cymbomonas tetramitiformis]|uniref:Amidase domain-containing protein n=1 Tax=Cymbomonas tetramitiformis TaxID=36881 RepID=A0AAE0KSK6_9CHLO|nr:hypothetical protein CYMTET_32044 [Cymbomonas tetramitiformis]
MNHLQRQGQMSPWDLAGESAFVERTDLCSRDSFEELPNHQDVCEHVLGGLSFALADTMSLEGFTTGFGHPIWKESHQAEEVTATGVRRALNAGATLLGKTVVGEFSYSLKSENPHYPMLPNPCPGFQDRSIGGSCSGGALAVATR